MATSVGREEQKDELVVSIEAVIHAFIRTKRRYRLLTATATQLDRVTDSMNARRTDKKETPIRNDAVLQLVRDCFDMFVIDLASIREGLVEAKGLLNEVKEAPARLQRCDPGEFAARPVVVLGDG